ncbi:MAG: hypothetical protein EPO25_18505 [Gammaproteobacteria bacterium]|nr:MAG: hypothetical protein EPO25_18505 [Gammaproteobacteria bacterium]
MKILVDHGAYENFGDLAMLEAALARLRTIPGVELAVQEAPVQWPWPGIRTMGYDIRPPGATLRRFARARILAGPPRAAMHAAARCWQLLAHHLAGLAGGTGAWPVRIAGGPQRLSQFCAQFDALFVAGGGDLNDVFPQALWRCCCLVRGFAAQGKPVFLSGQQIGPIRHAGSARLLRAALRRATFVGVREPGDSWRLATAAGLAGARLALTGDDSLGLLPAAADAIDAALAASGIGREPFLAVNIRIGPYVDVAADSLPAIARVLDGVAGRCRLPLLAVPISVADEDSDLQAAEALARCLRRPLPILRGNRLSAALLKGVLGRAHGAIGMSYHFCTFALSQGVPAIALYAGDYYAQKAAGLADCWGDARLAEPIARLDDEAPGRLLQLLGDEALRARLREAAPMAARNWEDAFAAHVVRPLAGRAQAYLNSVKSSQ